MHTISIERAGAVLILMQCRAAWRFNKKRPIDTNLEIGVAQKEGMLDYYVFNEPALNGFSAELSKHRDLADSKFKIQETIRVQVMPLKNILRDYADGKKIYFMSVDVEGLDIEVLKSNDWSKYRPGYVLAEVLESSLHELHSDPLVRFMSDQGYDAYAKQVNTVFFRDRTA